MKNQKEIEKEFKPLLQKLKKISSKNNNEPIYKSFTRWWAEAKFTDPLTKEGADIYITDEKGDGIIDAVVELNSGKFMIIQAKYNHQYEKGVGAKIDPCPSTGSNSFEAFDNIVIPSFDDKKSFEKYIKDQKVDVVKAGYYRKAFEAKEKDPYNLEFKFITTYDLPSDITYAFANLSPEEFNGINEIITLHNMEDEGSNPPAEDLILSYKKNSAFIQKEYHFGILSYVMLAELSDLVTYIKKYYPTGVPNIISRNVRTLVKDPHKEGTINNQILTTYNKKPEEFWLSHNGMTIICEKLTREKNDTKLRLDSPNVINGGQTLFSLREAKKIHSEGKVLLRIYEVEHNSKTDELIKKVIFRTNQQNPVHWHNLRALEDSQIVITRYFFDKGVFYQRRDGEHALVKHRNKISGLKKCKIVELTQILKIARDGAKGVHEVKLSKEGLFKDKDEFNELFNIEESAVFFQFVVKMMVYNTFKHLNHSGKRFVRDTIFGIFWDALKSLDTRTYVKWEKIVNDHKGKPLDVNLRKKSEIKGMITLVNVMYNNCDTIRKSFQKIENTKRKKKGQDEIMYDLRLFVSTKNLEPNKQAFKEAKQKFHNKILKQIKKLIETYQL